MHKLSLGIVSDELSPDFGEAARFAVEWGLSIVELRVLKTGRIPNVDKRELDEVLHIVKTNHLTVSALSPGIFKHSLSAAARLEHELTNDLPRTLDLARQFGAPIVIVFGFQREFNEPSDNLHRATDLLRRAAEMAESAGITLAVENEPGFWCDSGANTAQLIDAVGRPSLRANWDPCNGFGTSESPFPNGYESIKRFIANIHAKDTKKGATIECVPIGEGAIDWRGQLEAIVRDRVVNHVTIETHSLPLVEKSKRNVEILRSYLKEIESNQGIPL